MYHTLNIGAESLYSTRQGVDTAGHNIANAQTEGFSRQRVNLKQRHPSEHRGHIIGNGSYVGSITRAHDAFLEKQLTLAQADSGNSQARTDALQSIETIYSTEMQASIADQVGRFFNAMEDLSANPNEVSVRANVREAGHDLATAFHRVDASLREQRLGLNGRIQGIAKEISENLQKISKLNVHISAQEIGNDSPANDLRDQRDLLVRDIAQRMNISYYDNGSGQLTIRGPDQSLLVDGKYAATLESAVDSKSGLANLLVIDPEGGNVHRVDHNLQGGELFGMFDVRDNVIGGLIDKNNVLAGAIAENVNGIHRRGYGINEFKDFKGRDFFAMKGGDIHNAARAITISDSIQESSNAIAAAATPNAPGDNVIVNDILRLRGERLLENNNATFLDFYSNYVGLLGLDVERSMHKKDADDIVLGDLNTRRESVSGVSLDEEAVNLLRWQTAFAASSKVITTVDEMLETVLTLKR